MVWGWRWVPVRISNKLCTRYYIPVIYIYISPKYFISLKIEAGLGTWIMQNHGHIIYGLYCYICLGFHDQRGFGFSMH